MKMRRVVLSWSSGKDSAWSLYQLRKNPELEVVGLATTVNSKFDRVAMHAVRRTLLHRQAQAAGLSLYEIPIPSPCPNAEYERIMTGFVQQLKDDRVDDMAFGDLFLADIRAYRERQLQGSGITPLFPLWNQPTGALAQTMLDAGLKAVLTCVDPKQLAAEHCGRRFDSALLAELPASVDPCGENGEFHTFAFDGPMFRESIDIETGETVERDGFVFTDVLPVTSAHP